MPLTVNDNVWLAVTAVAVKVPTCFASEAFSVVPVKAAVETTASVSLKTFKPEDDQPALSVQLVNVRTVPVADVAWISTWSAVILAAKSCMVAVTPVSNF